MQGFLKLASIFAIITNVISSNTPIMDRFKNWIEIHKIQARDDAHLDHIFNNWFSNDKYIEEINSKNLSYTLGHNAYSGLNSDEFTEMMGFKQNSELVEKGTGFLRRNIKSSSSYEFLNVETQNTIQSSIDWRTKGVVGNVRDQGSCGSCWSFSGTSTIESAVAIKTGKLYDLSEQQSVSCAGIKYGNLGCNGGYYSGLWDYSKSNGGICSEDTYQYTSGKSGETGSCKTICSPISGTIVNRYVDVVPNSDSELMSALNVGTVSIAIEADTRSFQLYSSGIYNDYEGCNKNSGSKGANSLPNIDHAVVLVGYGTQENQDYYILRNSWSESWGENGYMLIGRGSKYGTYGMCGVLYDPMYPIV